MQFVALGMFFTGLFNCYANELNSLSDQGKPLLRTEADVIQGKKNVKSVVAQLKTLLLPSANLTKLKKQRIVLKPYYKIIKGADNRSTLIYRCRYSTAKALINSMESVISTAGTVEYMEEQNLIIINDATNKMDELKDALLAIDISSPQVLVEAKVVEVLLSEGMQRNLSFGVTNDSGGAVGVKTNPLGQSSSNSGMAADWTTAISGTSNNFSVAFQWLMNGQDAKILSSPNIVVSHNATASIVTGQDIPIQTIQVVSGSTTTSTDFKRVGVSLNVTPKLINGDSVTLRINPQVSNVLRYDEITQGGTSGDGISYQVPVISIRNIETDLTLKDGQVIMMGGLFSARETLQQERVPFLSDLPVLGELFTSKNVTKELVQLIFFIKINILSDDEIASGVIYDPIEQAVTSKKLGKLIRGAKKVFPAKNSTLEKVNKEFIEKSSEYR
jgi:type II secretory pathway component GspD/PulD (secretin)